MPENKDLAQYLCPCENRTFHAFNDGKLICSECNTIVDNVVVVETEEVQHK